MENPASPKVVFYDAATRSAVLVVRHGRRQRQRPITFIDPQAALAWCIARAINLVYVASPDPARN